MASTLPPVQQRVTLSGIDWETYQSIKAEPKNRNIRLTYYRGSLEIMASFPENKYFKKVIGCFVETLAETFVANLYPSGSTTLEREDLVSGSEPDECFYLTVNKIQKIKGKKRINLQKDPAPDLIAEVDITSRSKYREQVYSILQVPEVSQYNGQSLIMLKLEAGQYIPIQNSLSFPKVEAKEIERFLQQAMKKDYLALVKEFRQWLQSL